jgi:hypothetical protein
MNPGAVGVAPTIGIERKRPRRVMTTRREVCRTAFGDHTDGAAATGAGGTIRKCPRRTGVAFAQEWRLIRGMSAGVICT